MKRFIIVVHIHSHGFISRTVEAVDADAAHEMGKAMCYTPGMIERAYTIIELADRDAVVESTDNMWQRNVNCHVLLTLISLMMLAGLISSL